MRTAWPRAAPAELDLADRAACRFAPGGLPDIALLVQLSNVVMPNFVALFRFMDMLAYHFLSRMACSKLYACNFLHPPAFRLNQRLPKAIYTLGLSVLYTPVLPISPLIGVVALIVQYAVDQYIALRHSSKPRSFQVRPHHTRLVDLAACPDSSSARRDLGFPRMRTACEYASHKHLLVRKSADASHTCGLRSCLLALSEELSLVPANSVQCRAAEPAMSRIHCVSDRQCYNYACSHAYGFHCTRTRRLIHACARAHEWLTGAAERSREEGSLVRAGRGSGGRELRGAAAAVGADRGRVDPLP